MKKIIATLAAVLMIGATSLSVLSQQSVLPQDLKRMKIRIRTTATNLPTPAIQ